MSLIPNDFGRTLANLRKAAELKQDALGKAVGLDGSTISRYESSDLVPSLADAQRLLSAINTDEAKTYRDYVGQEWHWLSRPDFVHPDREALWRAERALKQINRALETSQADCTRAKLFRSALQRECNYLQDLSHDVPFIGEIAVGKTTVLSVAVGLLLPPGPEDRRVKRTVMEVGAGNSTICEVALRHDPERYGLVMHTCSEDEIVLYVNDLCAGVLKSCSDLEGGERRGVPREIERALRNMSNLRKRAEPTLDGKPKKADPILDSAAASSLSTLALEVLQKLDLRRRTKAEWWFEPGCDVEPLRWLCKTFSDVNNGRESDASLPASMTVIAPLSTSGSPFRLRFIDTRGIEGEMSDRPDLASYLNDTRAVPILCSSFYRALDGSIEKLLRSVREAGASESVETRSMILVLPQNDQAMEAPNDSGEKPETCQEGYENKRDKVRSRLEQWGYGHMPDVVFNADTDEPKDLLEAILGRINVVRRQHAERIEQTIVAVNEWLEEAAQAGIVKAYSKTHARLNAVYEEFQSFPRAHVSQPQNRLLTAIDGGMHPRTVWASVARQGTWYNLDFYHYLGMGVNSQAQRDYQGPFHELESALGLLLADDELKPLRGFLAEAIKNVEHSRGEFMKAAAQLGNDAFRPALKEARNLWEACAREYGTGYGYRSRVAGHLRGWFDHPDQAGVFEFVERSLYELWKTWFLNILSSLVNSCRPTSTESGITAARPIRVA